MRPLNSVLIVIAGAVVLGMLTSPARAEGSAGDTLSLYDAHPAARDTIEFGLRNLSIGFAVSNAYLETVREEEPNFCISSHLVLTGPQLIDILRRGLDRDPVRGGTPVSVAPLLALVEVFPCASR